MEKTTVFNLLIIDESGSMQGLEQQTINGCNETLNVVRSLQKTHGDTQHNLASIYLFQSNPDIPSRYLFKNKPIDQVNNLDTKVYRPWGATPLLDAIGSTISDLEAVASTHTDATCIVTIITDGYENSSSDYNYKQIADMISRLKELGWTINFIGANIDVEKVSKQMNIDNAMSFSSTASGTTQMWNSYKDRLACQEEERIAYECSCEMSVDDRIKARKARSKGFFSR